MRSRDKAEVSAAHAIASCADFGSGSLTRAGLLASRGPLVLFSLLSINMACFRLGASLDWKRSLGELTLIVLGVLIALAGNSWWERQRDRDRERAYLRQLLSDVRVNERRLDETIAKNTRNLTQVEKFIAIAFAAGGAPPADSIPLPAGYAPYEPLTGTYTALVQNGDLRFLRKDSLRHAIMAYAALMASTRDVLQHIETLAWRNVDQIVQAQITHMRPSGASGREDSNVRWKQPFNAESLLRDAELVGTMVTEQTIGENRVRRLRGLEQPTIALRRMLEAELGVKGQELGVEGQSDSSVIPP